MDSKEILVEDEDIIVLLPKRGFCAGHVAIVPKGGEMILEQVKPELFSKMMQVANKFSSILFDTFKCQGTNVLIQNGVPAGQINDIFSVNILPRYENDSMKLEWTPKSASSEDLDAVVKKFKSSEEKEAQKKAMDDKKQKAEKKSDDTIDADDKDNYLIRSLSRIP